MLKEKTSRGGEGVVVDQRDIDLIASHSQSYQLIRLSKQLRHRALNTKSPSCLKFQTHGQIKSIKQLISIEVAVYANGLRKKSGERKTRLKSMLWSVFVTHTRHRSQSGIAEIAQTIFLIYIIGIFCLIKILITAETCKVHMHASGGKSFKIFKLNL